MLLYNLGIQGLNVLKFKWYCNIICLMKVENYGWYIIDTYQ